MNQPQKFNKVTVFQYRKMTGKNWRTCFKNVRELNKLGKFNKVTVFQYRKETGKPLLICWQKKRELNKLGKELNEAPNTWPRPGTGLNARIEFGQSNGLLGRV